MATTEQTLETRIAALEELLNRQTDLMRRMGVPMPAEVSADPTEWPDYVEPGSDRHLAFLGLERVEPGSPDEVTFDCREGKDGVVYRLTDPVGPYVGYADPGQAARIALLQKVAVFEGGVPPVHDKAPPIWVPEDVMPELARELRRR